MTGEQAHNILYRFAFRVQQARAANPVADAIAMTFTGEELEEVGGALAIAVMAPWMLATREASEQQKGGTAE